VGRALFVRANPERRIPSLGASLCCRSQSLEAIAPSHDPNLLRFLDQRKFADCVNPSVFKRLNMIGLMENKVIGPARRSPSRFASSTATQSSRGRTSLALQNQSSCHPRVAEGRISCRPSVGWKTTALSRSASSPDRPLLSLVSSGSRLPGACGSPTLTRPRRSEKCSKSLQHCCHLFASHVKLLDDFIDSHAVFEVLKHDRNRHTSIFEHPLPRLLYRGHFPPLDTATSRGRSQEFSLDKGYGTSAIEGSRVPCGRAPIGTATQQRSGVQQVLVEDRPAGGISFSPPRCCGIKHSGTG
jgi:hypothetical protein